MNNPIEKKLGRKLLVVSLATLLGAGGIFTAYASEQASTASLPQKIASSEAPANAPTTTATKTAAPATTEQVDKRKDTKTNAVKDKTENLKERVIHDSYAGWNDPLLAHIAIYSGQALLRHLQAARQALNENKPGEAKNALVAASDFAGAIQKMMPFIVVVDQIKDAKGKLLSSESGMLVNDLLPIYESINQMEIYQPELAKKVRGKLKQAEAHAMNGDKQKAGEKLDEVAADVSETTIYMPVLYTSNQADKALKALQAKEPNTKSAKADIDNALNSLLAVGDGILTMNNKPTAQPSKN